jgi:dTDP-glucose 4,6-dehydratase
MSLKNKKVILTGGCGFIGNTMSKILHNSELNDLIVIDKMSYVSNDAYHFKNKIKVLKEDIQSSGIFKFIEDYKPDVIINMAAESHVDVSIKNPNIFLESNVCGTMNLLNAALTLETAPIFVQISTDEVYGDVSEGWSKECDPRVTSSPYSASKASAELFVEAYGRTYNLPYLITRSSNNYGPYQNEEKLIPKIINNILLGKKIPVYGDGRQERDWVYVDDNCSAIIHIIDHFKENNIFNIGGLETTNNLEIIKQICSIMNKDESEFIEFVKDRPGHDRRYAISIDKIKNESGWAPTTDLKTGLIKTIDWISSRNG